MLGVTRVPMAERLAPRFRVLVRAVFEDYDASFEGGSSGLRMPTTP
jgi:hypothetical protein